MKILVTGGTGFIGGNVVVALLQAGHRVEILDDLSNSHREVLQEISEACGTMPHLHELPVSEVGRVLEGAEFDAVLHLASLKSVEDSVADPLEYYEKNLGGTIAVCRAAAQHHVPRLIFSSSACVYGDNPHPDESTPPAPCSPYGHSKLFSERIIQDACTAHDMSAVCLRYFNPAGAHKSGVLGDRPKRAPKNLMPLLCSAAQGETTLKVFGTQFPTADGSPVRDYIHVEDLAAGHLAALSWLSGRPSGECLTVNLGSGRGVSVFSMAGEMAHVCECEVRLECCPPRAGDAPSYVADTSLAETLLGWSPRLSLRSICQDAWNAYRRARCTPAPARE